MRRVRRALSANEKAEIWQRWKRGESLESIGRALGRVAPAVAYVVAAHGGVPPPDRRRSRLALSPQEREEISRGLVSGLSLRGIGNALHRAPSTVSREVRRHGGRHGYRAAAADARAWARARRPKSCRLATHPTLRALVVAKLAADWSPQQIAGGLKQTFPHNRDMQVSHETIYLSLFVQSRGVLKKALLAHLRRRHTMRRSQRATRTGRGHGQIIDAVSIRERPAEAADRAVPGHWEGDLLTGAGYSRIATLVERHSRFVLRVRVPDKSTTRVVQALARKVRTRPHGLKRSLTWDRGTELAAHKRFTVATNVRGYFCDPHSPWQRGSNEHTNGLLRQYLPKGTTFADLTQAQLNTIAQRLNTRPRKTLGYRTPADTLATAVASTP